MSGVPRGRPRRSPPAPLDNFSGSTCVLTQPENETIVIKERVIRHPNMRLTEQEKLGIVSLHMGGLSCEAIAKQVKRDPVTVYRVVRQMKEAVKAKGLDYKGEVKDLAYAGLIRALKDKTKGNVQKVGTLSVQALKCVGEFSQDDMMREGGVLLWLQIPRGWEQRYGVSDVEANQITEGDSDAPV